MTDKQAAARQVFDRYDLNGDGLISAAEFKQVMAEMGDFNVTEPVAQALINNVDANGDRLMSFDEFWGAMNR